MHLIDIVHAVLVMLFLCGVYVAGVLRGLRIARKNRGEGKPSAAAVMSAVYNSPSGVHAEDV